MGHEKKYCTILTFHSYVRLHMHQIYFTKLSLVLSDVVYLAFHFLALY